MASPQHQQLLLHSTEVSCNATGDSVSVKINSKPQLHGPASSCSSNSSSKHCKYSISSSCSSGESGARRVVTTGARRPKKLPQLFERSSWQWWNPRFDSTNLEEACLERCFPQTQRRFRYVLFYLAAACLLWSIYFGVNGARCDQTAFLVPTLGFLVFCILLLLFTFTRFYARLYVWVSLLLFLVTFALTLSPQLQRAFFLKEGDFDNSTGLTNAAYWETCLSPVGTFSLCMEVLLLLYTIMHLHLYLCVLLGLVYSTLFEILGCIYFASDSAESNPLYWLAPAKALLHICAHAIGIHLFIMSEVRSRSTFLKVGQSIMHGKDLEVEKALKERMIHSVMPRMVADELMKQGDDESENSVKRYSTSSPKNKKKKPSIPKAQIIFRPFNMKRMEPVSILFADIVGFTKMSANKSAHALVGLLNDLFGRFDRLCEITNCEKISTLGDCYYCVAGCPEPRADHAYCCIEMGLGMIKAIEQFCQEKKEMVNMRVGVHTGTVLCGILGMRRFKFDVWSNDVNLANLMEQLGVAGKVHISEVTASFLDDRYLREDGRVMERVGQSVVADQLKGLLQSLSLVAASAGRNGTGAAADSSQQSCVDADSTYWGACRWRLKTYLISGRKVERSQCSCSQLGLAGSESGDGASRAHTPETITTTEATHTRSQTDRTKEPCSSCSVMLVPSCDAPIEDSTVQNGCQEDHKNNTKPIPAWHSLKTQNGLLSPPPEEKLTNSQTSLCEMLQEKEKGKWVGVSMDQSALLPLRFKNIRERTDAHFVDVIKEDSLMKDYFFKPPINKLSLNFLEKDLEMTYRISYQKEVKDRVPVKTFASSTFSSFIDVLLSSAVFLFLTIGCFLKPWVSGTAAPPAAVAVCVLAILLELVSLVLSVRMAFYLEEVAGCTKHLLQVISGWIPRHFIGAILISLPALSVFSHITCEFDTSSHFTMFMCCAIIITIIQYCNFCQLSSWMRSSIATVVGAVLLILLYTSLCPEEPGFSNSSVPETLQPLDLNRQEVILAFFLLLLLVWFLNREFEVSYRLHYHGNVEADLHRAKIQTMRDQADWLLRNIIPYHVAEQLKVTQSYSKNHDNVGVIFASIVNFSEFYEENYEGGKECYRVLNELIGDFDELLNKQQYSNIEKIKTIGATYMAASGLNPSQCQDTSHPHRHLRTLFDFAKEMMCVVDDFNKDMLWFNFKLRVGFNHGPLTAGVIGTTKLLYDIWGDTVNIASRMDTTGVECRVQVSEESYRILNEMGYDFDYRGTVNVKGKGQMKTFLFPKSVDSGMVPQHQLSVSPDIRVQVDGSIGRSPTDELANMVPSAGGHGLDRTPPQQAAAAMEKLDVKDSSGHLKAAPFAVSSPGNTQRPLPVRDLAAPATHNLPATGQGTAEEEEGEEEEEEEETDELTKLKISESL